MVRDFETSVNGWSITGAQTLFAMSPDAVPPGIKVEFLRIRISQTGSNLSAQQRVQLVAVTGGWSPYNFNALFAQISLVSLNLGDPNASTWTVGGGAMSGNDQIRFIANTEGGAKTIIKEDVFNTLDGWTWEPEKDETIIMEAGTGVPFAIFFPVAPSYQNGWNISVVFREVS